MTDSRDGLTYKTVVIGTQTWMAQNLAYLPSVSSIADSSDTDAEYYVYGYDGTSVSDAKATSNYTTYGVLYNETAASSACPSGWHLPSNNEFETLQSYVGGTTNGAKYLKATSGWKSWSGISNLNTYGFSALPGGRYFHQGFNYGGEYGYWRLTSGEYNEWYMMYTSNDIISSVHTQAMAGISVRCLEDN